MMTMKDVDGYFWVDSNVIEKNFYVLKKEMNKNKWKKRKNEESLLAIKKKGRREGKKKKRRKRKECIESEVSKIIRIHYTNFFHFFDKNFFFQIFFGNKKKA